MAGSFPKSFEYILGLKSLTPAFTAIRSFVTFDVPSNVPANQNTSEQIYYNSPRHLQSGIGVKFQIPDLYRSTIASETYTFCQFHLSFSSQNKLVQ